MLSLYCLINACTLTGLQTSAETLAETIAETTGGTNETMSAGAEIPAIPAHVATSPVVPAPSTSEKKHRYSVVATNAPVKDLLSRLASDAGLNIDIHPDIKGKVTMNLAELGLPEILEHLSGRLGLRTRISGNNMVVSPDLPYAQTYEVGYLNLSRDSVSESRVATEISTAGGSISGTKQQAGNKSSTQVNNVSGNHFWKTLVQNITMLLDKKLPAVKASTTAADRVVVNPMGGIVSVYATAREHASVKRFIHQLMASVRKQVLIEATIVEVELNDRFQAGVDWQRLSDNAGLEGNGASFRSLMTDGNYTTPPVFSVTYNNAGRNIFTAIKALQMFGETRVLSRPKIMAVNNQTALLKVVDETVYFTVERELVEATQGSAARETFSSEVHTVPVGLIMSVMPQISSSNSVIMNVRPTISRITGFKADPAPRLAGASFDNLVPEIQVREMESLLHVSSGETVVLGGLMQHRNDDDRDSVPVLSDIPVIGSLFGYRDKMQTKTELLIFLKPTVISARETGHSGLMSSTGLKQSTAHWGS